MTGRKSLQGSRVQQELEILRQKQLAKNQRDKLQDLCSKPLTTPEEAAAFLASMRDKSSQREFTHQASAGKDGMESWYLQIRQREKDLRERRREAEELLRGYRGGRESMGAASAGGKSRLSTSSNIPTPVSLTDGMKNFEAGFDRKESTEENDKTLRVDDSGFPKDPPLMKLSSSAGTVSDSIDDPRVFHKPSTSSEEAEAEDVEPTTWLDFISNKPGAKFPPAAGRYHLYLSYACPGSHRVLIVRALKRLQDVVSVSYVHPTWKLTGSDKHRGWVFGDPDGEPFANTVSRGGPFPAAYHNTFPDPFNEAKSIRELYELAGDTAGKYTIPILWDTQQQTIVNNESSDIAYMLNSCFNEFCDTPDLDLYTEFDEEGVVKLNEVSDWLSPLTIHGVYRCGFAKNQRAYDRAIAELCEAFDRADDLLSQQRYLTGNDTLTDADIRLFVSLIRFDEVYSVYFKANARLVMLTPSLLNFCREIYQLPGVAETCQMDQIKAHFYGSHAEWNKYSVIPRGLGFMELLEMPHDRDLLEFEGDENADM